MAQTALEVVSLDRAKRELSVDIGVTDDDALLTGHVNAAVDWVSAYLGAPLIQVAEARFGGEPLRAYHPVAVAGRYLQHVIRVRYWSDGAPLRDSPDMTVANADLGRVTEVASDFYEIWPPVDGWPDRERDSRIMVDCVHEVLAPIPEGIVAACVIVLRQLYDGIQDIRPSATLRALLAPYERISYWSDSFAETLTETYIDLSPATPTPATPTNYLGVRTTDTLFTPADFTESGTTDALDVPSEGYIAFAHPATEGDFTYVYVYFGTNRNLINQIGAWTQATHDIVLGGAAHRVIYSNQYQHTVPGLQLVVEAG